MLNHISPAEPVGLKLEHFQNSLGRLLHKCLPTPRVSAAVGLGWGQEFAFSQAPRRCRSGTDSPKPLRPHESESAPAAEASPLRTLLPSAFLRVMKMLVFEVFCCCRCFVLFLLPVLPDNFPLFSVASALLHPTWAPSREQPSHPKPHTS